MSLFGFGKKTDKELMKENDRALRKVGRDLERERLNLEREEKRIEMEIKKAAKQGNKEACTVLAKQLVQVRKQKARTYTAGSKVQAVGTQAKIMQSSSAMAGTLKNTTVAMGQMNKVMDPAKMNKTLQDFSKATMKMEMTDEMISDTLDDIFDEPGDEEESDQIVNKILDEIGIEISGKLADAPAANDKLGEKYPSVPTTDDLEAQLAKLKSS